MHIIKFLFGVIISAGFLISNPGCDPSGKPTSTSDSTIIHAEDSTKKYYVIDTTGMGREWNEYNRVKNLLEFHTKDTMKTDSTYIATLALGKNISSFELTKKIEDIVEPGGKVKVRDTTQEVSMYMSATLEDKAPDNNPNFIIELLGGNSSRRKYDEKSNKMIWQWNVTPKIAGNHELILSVSHVDEQGIDLGSPETRHHSITIFSEKKKGGFGRGIVSFFEKYWQWLLGVVALPLFIAWFTTRRRNATYSQANENNGKTATGGKKKRNNRH